jgi:hypothetical protein
MRKMLRDNARHFVFGMGSIIDLQPSPRFHRVQISRGDFNCGNILHRDWIAIEIDLARAVYKTIPGLDPWETGLGAESKRL